MSFSEWAEFQLSSIPPVKDSTVSSAHKTPFPLWVLMPQLTHSSLELGAFSVEGKLCWEFTELYRGHNCETFGFSQHLLKLFLPFLQLVFNSIAKSSSCPRRGETKNLKEQSSLLILNKKSCTSDEGGTDQTEKTLKPPFNPSIKEKTGVNISLTLWIFWATSWTSHWN